MTPGLSAAQLHAIAADHFELRKPYFVGQHALADVRVLSPAKGAPTPPEFTWQEPENAPLKRTQLYDWHRAHTKHIVPFAGWEMPVWYTGVFDEHNAIRKAAGLFDVSHMGVFEASGPHAEAFLDLVCTNYVRWYAPGESFYSYLLDPDGKVIDDLLVYRRSRDRFQIVVNASNADKDWAWLNAVNNGEVLLDRERPDLRVLRPAVLRDLKDPASGPDMRIDLALQGPASLKILQSLTDDPRLKAQLGRVRKTGVTECVLAGPSTGSGQGFDLVIARTGYTGEEMGFELFVHPDRAVAFWETLLEAGKPFGLQPTGLAARDSTRTEAGLPLYGHELEGHFGISPAGARLRRLRQAAQALLHRPVSLHAHRTDQDDGGHPLPHERPRCAHAQDRRPGRQQEGPGYWLCHERGRRCGWHHPGPGLRAEPLRQTWRRNRHLQRPGEADDRKVQQGRTGPRRQGGAARRGDPAPALPGQSRAGALAQRRLRIDDEVIDDERRTPEYPMIDGHLSSFVIGRHHLSGRHRHGKHSFASARATWAARPWP